MSRLSYREVGQPFLLWDVVCKSIFYISRGYFLHMAKKGVFMCYNSFGDVFV